MLWNDNEDQEDGLGLTGLFFIKVHNLEDIEVRILTDHIIYYLKPQNPPNPEHRCTLHLTNGHPVCIKDTVEEMDSILGLNW